MSAVAGIASGVLGGAGGAVGGFLSADAANNSAKVQSRLLDQMRTYTQQNMDPELVNQQALKADQERAANRIALQKQIDPSLAAVRPLAEAKLLGQVGQIGTSPSDTIAALATQEAQTGGAGDLTSIKNQILQAAQKNISAGATLPPDVQAELMQSGLEGSGAVTGSASGGGIGGTMLRTILGSAGIALQTQREQQAQQEASTAAGLEQTRQQILQNLFPKLQQQQLANMSATTGALGVENQMLPEAGLSGQNVASTWLQRVASMNQLTGAKASVQGQGALGSGLGKAAAWGSIASMGQNPGVQSAASSGSGSLGSLASFFNTGNAGIGASGNFAG